MKRALILVACLLAVSQAVPVHTEDSVHKGAPQNLEEPQVLQPQAQMAANSNTANSIFYPVPPADAFLGSGFGNFLGTGSYGYRPNLGYGLPYGYGYPGYGLPTGLGYSSAYGGYGNPFVQPYGLNQFYTGYSYPPIVISLPRQQA